MDARRIASILVPALDEGRDALTELEGLALLEALGLETPARLFVRGSAEALSGDAATLPGDKVVVKIISPDILHKTEVGGVAIVDNEGGAIVAAIKEMEGRLGTAGMARPPRHGWHG